MSQPAASTSAATTIYYAQPGGHPAAGDAGPVPAYPPSQLGLPQTVPASSAQYLPRQQPPLTLQPPPIRPRGQSQQAIQQQQQPPQPTPLYQHSAQPPPLAQGGGATGGGAPSGGVRWEGGQMLDLYIADYCLKRGFAMTAQEIGREAGLGRIEDLAIPINAQQGLLYEWWSVFWEIFQAQNKDQAAGGTTGGPAQDDASVYVQAQQLQAPLGVRQLSVHRPDYAPGGGPPAGGSLDPFYAHQSAAATGRMTPLHPQYQQFQQPQALPVRQSSGGTPLYATAVPGGPGQHLAVQQQQQRYQQQQPPQIQMHSPSPNGLVAGAGGEGGFAYMQIHGHPLQSQPVVLAHQPRPTPPQPNQLQLQQQSQPQPPSVLHNPHHPPPPPFAQQPHPQHHPLHPFESLGLRHPIDQETVMFILGNLGLATRAPHTLSPEEKADVQVRYAHMMGQQPPQTQAGIAAMNRLYASGELEEERKQGLHFRDVTASPISQAAVTPVATTAINGAPSKRPRKSPPRGGASGNGRQMYLVPPQTGFAPTPGSPSMAEGGAGAGTANGHHLPSAPPATSSGGPRSSVKRKASGAAAASPAASSAKAPTPKNPAMPPPPSTPGAGAHIPSVASVSARSNPPTPKESLIAPSPSSRSGPGPPTPQQHGGGTPAASTTYLQAGSPHPLGSGGSPAAGSPHPGQGQQQQYFYPGAGGAGGGGSSSTPAVSPATLQAQAQAQARQQRQQQQPPTTPAALLDAAGGGGGGGNGFDAFPAEWTVGGGMANGNGHGGGKGGASTNGHHHSPAAMPTPGRGDERPSSSLEHRHHTQLAASPHPSTAPTAPTPPPLAPAPSTEYADIDAELAAFDFSAYMADFPDDDLVTGISVIGDEANGGVTERTSGEGGGTVRNGEEDQDDGGDKMASKGDGGKESEI